MPAISELPDALSAFTGAELIAIVQDQETRQAPLSALLAASPARSLANARWIKTMGAKELLGLPTPSGIHFRGDFLNVTEFTFEYDSNSPWGEMAIFAMAKVDVRRDPQDILLWEYTFTADLIPLSEYTSAITFDGNNNESQQGTLFLEGRYTLTTTANGDFDNGKTIEVQEVTANGDFIRLLHTFTNNGQTTEFTSTYGQVLYIKLVQPNGLFYATLDLLRTHYYPQGGSPPFSQDNGDLLYITAWAYPPNGELTARARLLAANGELLAESAQLTLVFINIQGEGGGGES